MDALVDCKAYLRCSARVYVCHESVSYESCVQGIPSRVTVIELVYPGLPGRADPSTDVEVSQAQSNAEVGTVGAQQREEENDLLGRIRGKGGRACPCSHG